jgi:hypothetical protein
MRTFTLLSFLPLLLSAMLVSADVNHPSSSADESRKERIVYLKNISDKMPVLLEVNESTMLKKALLSHKLDSIVSETRTTVTGPWTRDWKSEFTYTGGMNNQWIESSWDGELLKWNIDSRTEWVYNDNDLPVIMTIYAIPENGVSLERATVMKIDYDDQNRVGTVIYEEEQDDSWGEALKQVYVYNSSGKISQIDSYTMEAGSWLFAMKNEYSYNASGYLTGMSLIFIDEGDEILFSSSVYTVDANGRVLSEEFSTMNYFTFELEKFSKSDYTYTVNGDVSVISEWMWDSESEVWKEGYKEEYSYNNSVLMVNVMFPSYFNLLGQFEAELLSFQRLPTGILFYDFVDGVYVNLEKETYFYAEINTTIARTVQEKGYAMYPVPAGEKVIFTWSGEQKPMELEIYSIDGRLVISKQVESLVPVDVQSLNEGMYMFRLKNENQISHSGKLVIQR